MSEEAFENLKASMPELARKSYGEGSGSELEVRRDKNKNPKYPPKMAFFGSSSRFIYTLVHEKMKDENFVFELQLPTKVGGTANLGFVKLQFNSHRILIPMAVSAYLTLTP
ncbi:MAG: hypothetical protein IJ262_08030 [Clostridia bacterium]|nr:hypothetical protein [Clostridia bacterium]